MDPQDEGLLALASLQKMVLELRLAYDAQPGPDLPWIHEEWAPEAARALRALDVYLTGKDENRREPDDVRRLAQSAMDLTSYHVHLSDGGYSRITLRPIEGAPVVLDRGLSSKKVVERWDALTR